MALRGLRAAQDAVLAAEEAERRAASAVHDVVLSVLRAVVMDDPPLPSVLATKAQLAQDALARGWSSFADLGSALRRQALGFAPELNVACRIDGDLDVPAAVAEALSGAVGEALRNVAMHAGVRDVTVTAHSNGPGGVEVTVHDDGAGFDPARVGPASTGLRNSVRRRMRDTSGTAAVISSPGEGTTVILTWQPPEQAAAEPVDLLAWARRVAPRPGLVFLGFMLPILLSSLVLLCLRWDDQRWQPVPVAVFLGMLGLAALCARYLSEVRMTGRAALGLVAANTVLATVGTLAVAPGATDAFAWWVAGVSGIVIAAVYFIRGPAFGLSALVFDAAALTAGLVVTGGGIAASGWVSVLTSPAIDAGLAVGFLAAFRGLSRYAESQLAEYGERAPDPYCPIDLSYEGDEIVVGQAESISRPLRLTVDEACALLVALRMLAEVPGREDRSALARLIAKLEAAAGEAASVSSQVEVQVDIPDSETEGYAGQIYAALSAQRRLHLQYYVPGRDQATEHEVDPMRLLVVEGRPYLEGWSQRVEGVRLGEDCRVIEPAGLADAVRAEAAAALAHYGPASS